MSETGKPVLVAGATGRQGGAVLRRLMGLGHPVRASAVLRVQDFWSSGAAREGRPGINAADAATTGIAHLVYSSVGGAERNSGIGYRVTKWQIEQHICAAGLPATMLRPATFMENYHLPAVEREGATERQAPQ